MKYFLSSLVFIILFLSCEPDTKHMDNLNGDWRGVAWTKDGQKADRNARALIMRFDGVESFVAHIGENPMKGKYRVDGEDLYLTENGKSEIDYEIEKLTADSLFLKLDHRGSDEQMVFIRKYKMNTPGEPTAQ